jgi:hypothetical protein
MASSSLVKETEEYINHSNTAQVRKIQSARRLSGDLRFVFGCALASSWLADPAFSPPSAPQSRNG